MIFREQDSLNLNWSQLPQKAGGHFSWICMQVLQATCERKNYYYYYFHICLTRFPVIMSLYQNVPLQVESKGPSSWVKILAKSNVKQNSAYICARSQWSIFNEMFKATIDWVLQLYPVFPCRVKTIQGHISTSGAKPSVRKMSDSNMIWYESATNSPFYEM